MDRCEMKRLAVCCLALLVATQLSSCESTSPLDRDSQVTLNWPVEKLYNEAKNESNGGNYGRAVRLYKILQSRYPYGRFAEQSLMDQAYAEYRDEKPVDALQSIARFEKLYPKSSNMDYVLYLKSLVLFNEDSGLFNQGGPTNWEERDPKANKEAYQVLNDLVKRYPNSRYAHDATKRINKIVDSLGGHELSVARYYMNRGGYLAAANRAQNVVKDFSNTPHVEEALAIMELAYKKMGMNQLSQDARRVLELNYPQSRYLAQPWKDTSSMPWWRAW